MTNLWNPWFAWHPIIVKSPFETNLVFWETVNRRRVYIDGKFRWQYSLIDGTKNF